MTAFSSTGVHNAKKYGAHYAITAAIAGTFLITSSIAARAESPVGLGTTANFAVLAATGITNTGATTVSDTAGGDMGSAPNGAFTGSGPGADSVTVTNGTKYVAAELIVTAAKAALVTAYNDAAGRTSTATISVDLAGQTLVSGVYTSA